MIFPWRGCLDFIPICISLWMQWKLAGWLPDLLGWRASAERTLRRLWWISAIWMLGSAIYGVAIIWPSVPTSVWMDWSRGTSIAWGLAAGGLFVACWVLRRFRPRRTAAVSRLAGTPTATGPSRRRLLSLGQAALLAAPVVIVGAGVVVERHRFRTVETELVFPGLPPDLDGLRIVQISDIHRGPFLPAADVERVVDMANETRADLAVVTGDLITVRDDYLSDCLGGLRRLRADAGVLGCLGNHEIVARCEARAKEEGAKLGLDFLRQESRQIRFGSATLNVAGVDYQRMGEEYLVGAEEMRRPDAFNLLLSHNPDVFPVAAGQGWDLTLAGHTHGGQLTIEGLEQYLNVMRIFTPYVYGTYRLNDAAIYVNRGIGTVGVPARLGAPPEVVLIRLRSA